MAAEEEEEGLEEGGRARKLATLLVDDDDCSEGWDLSSWAGLDAGNAGVEMAAALAEI